MDTETISRALCYAFRNDKLLTQALTHPSYALQHHVPDNQRLEFLGDAVLEICVSRVLYARYPQMQEGQLTRRRALLVREATLAAAARRLGLGRRCCSITARSWTAGGRSLRFSRTRWRRCWRPYIWMAAWKPAVRWWIWMMGDYEPEEEEDRDAKSLPSGVFAGSG